MKVRRARPTTHEAELWRRFVLVLNVDTLARLAEAEPERSEEFFRLRMRERRELEALEPATPRGPAGLPAD